MNDNTVEINAVMAALVAIGAEDINTEYSGRGMYGEECFSVRLPSSDAGYVFLVQLTAALMQDAQAVGEDVDEAKETAVRLAQAARTDQMGLDTVMYFPGWKLFGAWEY